MSSPSDPRSPGEQADPAQPSTREIPVVTPAAAAPPLPPHPGAFAPNPVSGPGTAPAAAVEGPQPTGPVDFVPGLPGAGTPAPPREKRRSGPHDRTALAGVGLAALSVVLLQLGLVDGVARLWPDVTLWSAFATAATVLGLLALAVRVLTGKPSARVTTRLVAAAVLALAIFWLLVVLPIVASDAGFLVTASLLALGGALWLGPAKDR